MKRILIFLVCSLLFCGCITWEPKINPVREWEGHYYSINDATNALGKAELHADESIWILSNGTLYRLYKKEK